MISSIICLVFGVLLNEYTNSPRLHVMYYLWMFIITRLSWPLPECETLVLLNALPPQLTP